MQIVRSFLASALLAAVAGAQTLAPAPAPEVRIISPPSHRLATGELVQIKVFGEPELETEVRIPEDGRITFPLIGDVSLADKTIEQATRLIHERLKARFLVNPQVTIAVLEQAKRLFTVLGQVQRPGTYRFPDRQSLDLIQVIGIAGGYTRLADAGRITVKRQAAGEERVFRVNGKRLARDERAEPFVVEAGDLITVGERLF